MLPKTQALCRLRKLARQLSGWRCLPSGLTTRVLPPEQTWWRREPVLNSCPQTSTHAPWPVHAHRLAHDYINKCNMKMVVGLFLMCRVKLCPGFGFPTLCPIPVPLQRPSSAEMLQEAGSARCRRVALPRASLSME